MRGFEGENVANVMRTITAPVRGLNAVDSIAGMQSEDALVAENVVCYPDRVEMRYGDAAHSTGYAKSVKALHTYTGFAAESLWATTDDGVFNATAAGAVGAAAIALTNGQTQGVTLATGAGVFLTLFNGTDSCVQYDGAVWAAIAAFAGVNTNTLIAGETYKQRMYLIQKNTLTLWYLGVNAVAGAATSYPLGAIFRRGGSLKAIGTWTVDGGVGPDDHLVVVTTAGEVAVFSGTNPADPAAWFLRGVFYIGEPVGNNCLYKFGGEILCLTKGGLLPLSRALQTASIDRSPAISNRIRQLFADLMLLYGATPGWQMISHPDVPFLLVNVPGTTTGLQLVMHAQTGAWSTFSAWQANCWARMAGQLYYGGATYVRKGWSGASDSGVNIVASIFSAFTVLNYNRTKHIVNIRPMFRSNGNFSFTLGVANDFSMLPTASLVAGASSSALWGTGLWGTAVWSSTQLLTRDWRTVPDTPGVFKALYTQIASNTARVALYSSDALYKKGGTF